MKQLIDLYKKSKTLYHAYFFVGDKDKILSELIYFLEGDVGIDLQGNPDFWIGKFHNLNIDDAREISESSQKKDFVSGKKIFIVQTDFIGLEAQNSLLKVFEEPTDGTHFFIISPQDNLLPTLRSRMQIISLQEETTSTQSILNLKLSDRLSKVKKITDSISDEEGTKQDAISFLNQIESEIYSKGVEKYSKELEICEKARVSLYDRGAPVKIILEQVMLGI